MEKFNLVFLWLIEEVTNSHNIQKDFMGLQIDSKVLDSNLNTLKVVGVVASKL